MVAFKSSFGVMAANEATLSCGKKQLSRGRVIKPLLVNFSAQKVGWASRWKEE
jgi:hypothetical protein